MTFILFLFSAVVGLWVLLNFTPCNTGKNSFFDRSILNYFKNLSRYVFIEKSYQASSSIYIDLDAQCVSSFTEVFLWKTFIQVSFHALQNNSTLFPINNMSFTYTYQKWCSASTHFLVNTGFTVSLYKNYMLWSTYQSVYSNSEMLAPVHRWIAGACTFC